MSQGTEVSTTLTKKKSYTPVEIDDAQLAELEDKHDDVMVLRGGDKAPWLVVVRRPTRQETLGYKSHQKRDQLTASEQLIKRIVVYPTGGEFDKQLDRWPFFPDGICQSDCFKEFVGVSVSDDVKR